MLTIRVRQFQKSNENFKKVALHLKRIRKRNKELFNDKYQLRKISLNVDDLILKHDIKFDNKYDFKFVFWWDESFRIQRAKSMKDIYILKEMNETRFERIYADNRLKQFKTKNVKSLLTR